MTFSDKIGNGPALLGGFEPRKTRTLACRLPGCDTPKAAVAICRTWGGHLYFHFDKGAAYLEWPRISEEWLTLDAYHREAVAEIQRQVEKFGEALIALNEEDDARPRGLFVVAPDDDTRWKIVRRVDFRRASLGPAAR